MKHQVIRVLLVEHETNLRQSLAKYLREGYSYQVVTAADRVEALTRIDEALGGFDVVLIDDGQEPELSSYQGIRLMKTIRASVPHVEFILFGGTGKKSGVEALRAGVSRYLRPPFEPEELALLIEQVVEGQRLKGAAQQKQILEQLMHTGAALLGKRGLSEVLTIILRGVQAIGFDRVRLYLLSEDRTALVGQAQVGMDTSFVGLLLPVADDVYMQMLFEEPRPQLFSRSQEQPVPHEQRLAKETVNQWACVPLILPGTIVGKLSVDNKFSGREIKIAELEIVALFANQAAVAIHEARLRAKEQEAAQRAEQRTRHLQAIQEVSNAIRSLRDLNAILTATCQAAVNLFRVDHSGFVLFDSEGVRGEVVAEYPPLGTFGQVVPLRGVSAEEEMLASKEPLVIGDVTCASELGVVRDILAQSGIRSILIVPVVFQERLLGSFSLDAIDQQRAFTQDELELCQILAAQVAAAIENAQLFSEIKEYVGQLETLQQTTLAITSQLERDTLLRTIIQQAVALLGGKSGGLYEYDHKQGEFTLIALYGQSDTVLGHTLKIGEGAGWLERAMLQVPLRWQKRTIGFLYVTDEVGRQCTPEEARLLKLFADHAAIGLVNAELVARDARKLRRLERLAQASREMMGNLEHLSLDERLTLIAKHAREILDVESCGVWLVSRPGYISLEASAGHREGGFQKRLEVPICSTPGSGLTGHIAYQGLLFNAHGDVLSNHPAGQRTKPTHTPSGICYSLLAMPLKSKHGDSEALMGLLRADNKKDNQGQIGPTVTFTQEDEWILQLFADAVVVAIEGAELVTQLGLEKEQSARLVDSSPAGVVALDRDGIITGFSDQAAELMGYQREEILGEHVSLLYGDEKEPRRIGRLLHEAAEGKLTNCETFVHHKDGTHIPLRLSARWLYNAHGESIGSVGYFEDLRAIREVEQRLALLLKASNMVGQADNLTSGLQSLAEMLTTHLTASFCKILFLNESKQWLEVQGAYLLPFMGSGRLGKHLLLAEWPKLAEILARGEPTLLEVSDHATQPMLVNLSRHLELQKNIQSLMLVPLQTREGVVGLLSLGELHKSNAFSQQQKELAAAIAEQMASLIERIRLHERTQRMFSQLSILHKISDYIQASEELDEILHVVLTGVTAGYGLGFNRAALLLLDERSPKSESPTLVVRMAIGHLTESEAYQDWEQHNKRGLEHFDRYLELLKEGQPFPTPLSERLHGLRLRGQEVNSALFAYVIAEQKEIVITEKETLDQLPATFIEAFQPTLPLAIVPLLAHARVIGLLVVDNKFTKSPITSEVVAGLMTFANTAAIAIENTQLYQETEEARQRLRSFFKGSNTLVSPQELAKVLAEIVENACLTAHADGVSLILIDEMGQVRRLITAGIDEPLSEGDVIRPNGLSMKVMRSGTMEVIEETCAQAGRVNPGLLSRQIGAALCLPVSLEGQPIGVMWFNYHQSRHFSKAEIEAAQLYVNQAAIAYDSARRIRELEHMRQAAEALAGAAGRQEVLTQIVRSAREVLQADSAIIWSYDAVRNRYLPASSVAAGVSEKVWEEFRKAEPRVGGTAYTVMEEGWVGVHNVDDWQHYPFLGSSTRRLLTRIGVGSFQGIALRVGNEKLGVLYVNYRHPRHFSHHEQQAAQTFANHAALALKKAKLLDQLSAAHNAARVVAEVMVLEENLENTLRSVALGTKSALNCDAITVYVYDQNRNLLRYPPIMIGVRYPGRTTRFPKVPQTSIVLQMLKRDEMYIASPSDPLFKKRRFTQDEGIASLVAIPLKVGRERVGVIFVNYRTPHSFTNDELTNISLFSNQAAVAIRNAQLYERVQKRAEALEALYEAGRAVTSSLELSEIVARLVLQAQRVASSGGKQLSSASIDLLEGTKMRQLAFLPMEGIETTPLPKVVDLKQDARIGITGRAIVSDEPQLVGDVTKNPDYLPQTLGTRSELAVPIKSGNKVIGAVNVEHLDVNAFDQADQRALEALAAQAAIAIENARLYDQVKQRAKQFQTLYETSTILAAELSLNAVLKAVVDQACDLTSARYGLLGVLDVEGQLNPFVTSGLTKAQLERLDGLPTTHGLLRLLLEEGKSIGLLDVREHPDFIGQYPAGHPDISSFLGVPIQYKGRTIGDLYVANKQGSQAFSQEDKELLELLAAQAAVAIENARLFEQTKKASQRLTAIHQLSTETTSSEKVREEILEKALYEMVRLFEVNQGCVLIFDWGQNEGRLIAHYPVDGSPCVSIPLRDNPAILWIEQHRKALMSENALDDPRLICLQTMIKRWQIKSMLLVPLLIEGTVRGLIGLNVTERQRGFSSEEQELAQTMVNHVASAIENAQLQAELRSRVEELRRTKEMLAGQSAVAWMGMISSHWRHAIEGHAITIVDEVAALRRTLRSGAEESPKNERIEKKVAKIERLAKKIQQKPMTPPLSSEEQVRSVPVNALFQERLQQLLRVERYNAVEYRFESTMAESVTVRISPEWLRRVFDILIDNAVEAVSKASLKQIIVTTSLDDGCVLLSVSDTGPGIAAEVRPLLFQEPIKREKGLGIGLLMAQTIAQTYGGEIELGSTSASGTTIIMRLPQEQ